MIHNQKTKLKIQIKSSVIFIKYKLITAAEA